MRAKRKNVCQECRSRKLACDGKLPACSQCTLRRVTCTGYQQEFLFVPFSSETKKQAELKDPNKTISIRQPCVPTDTRNISSLELRLGETDLLESKSHQGLEDDVHYILQHYTPTSSFDTAEFNPSHNQICGAWVEALPHLVTAEKKNAFLFSAIKTLATSLRCLSPTGRSYKSYLLEIYCRSLGLMSEALEEAHGVFRIEHCVAIMCLAVSDMMIPNLGSGWVTHLNGIRDWMESIGPGSFSSGILRTLFVGIRPLLLFSSILSRQTTFLAQDVWTTTPFHGQTTPMMQQLLSQASKLPNLLERFDFIRGSVEQADFVAIGKLWQDFQNLMEKLQEWESAQWEQASSPLFWVRPTKKSSGPADVNDLWFLNLMVANSMTHYWAFKIITKLHLGELGTALANLNENDSQWTLDLPVSSDIEISVATLAAMICDSMAYLLQPEMKLYGPYSTFFALLAATEVFKRNPDRYSVQILRYRQIVAQLAALGLKSPEL